MPPSVQDQALALYREFHDGPRPESDIITELSREASTSIRDAHAALMESSPSQVDYILMRSQDFVWQEAYEIWDMIDTSWAASVLMSYGISEGDARSLVTRDSPLGIYRFLQVRLAAGASLNSTVGVQTTAAPLYAQISNSANESMSILPAGARLILPGSVEYVLNQDRAWEAVPAVPVSSGQSVWSHLLEEE